MRFRGPGQPYEGLVKMTSQGSKWTGEIKLVPDALREPFGWAKPRRVFVNSMSDLFHESVPFDFIASVFAVMSVTSRHTYQVLTKRPARMLEFFKWVKDGAGVFDDDRISHALPRDIEWRPQHNPRRGGYDNCGPGFPYENVWLGVSVENQKAADERIPLLLQCPAVVHWISAEPLLGPIYLERPMPGPDLDQGGGAKICQPWMIQGGIDWVVVGGESGRSARPMHPEWARSLRDQCERAGVPFLFKQWGEFVGGTGDRGLFVHLQNGQSRAGDKDTHVWGGGHTSQRVGKKAAGRNLDGVQHDGYPEGATA